MLPHALNPLMQNLTSLMQVRDSAALDVALISVLTAAIGICHHSDPHTIGMVQMRALVEKSKTEHGGDHILQAMDVGVCLQAIHILQDKDSGHAWLDGTSGQWLLLPLKKNLQHKHAAIVIQHPHLDASTIALLEHLLSMFYHYANLISENERDALTGLLNRKTFDDSISKLLLRDSGTHQHYLAIFDIDFFKRINDTYGHLIGDEVLLLLSRLMTNTFREGDLLFRFGGEEFVGVFPCTSEVELGIALQRFRTALASYDFPQVGQMTLSIGTARMGLDVLPNVVLERADEALYYAKAHGRDQVCCYEQLCGKGLLNNAQIQGEVELF